MELKMYPILLKKTSFEMLQMNLCIKILYNV